MEVDMEMIVLLHLHCLHWTQVKSGRTVLYLELNFFLFHVVVKHHTHVKSVCHAQSLYYYARPQHVNAEHALTSQVSCPFYIQDKLPAP